MRTHGDSKVCRYALAIALALVGITAVAGGGQLVHDPTGRSTALSLDWLRGSPFADYTIPGLVLLAVVGGGSLAASAAAFVRARSAGWLAVGAGFILVIYIGVEVGVVGWRTVLQPLYLLLALVILCLGALEWKSRRTPRSDAGGLDSGWTGVADGRRAGR